MINSKYCKVKKLTALAAAVMTAAMMLGGCGDGKSSKDQTQQSLPENYISATSLVHNVRVDAKIKSATQNDIDRRYRNVIVFVDGDVGTLAWENQYGVNKSATGFIVQYKFTNTSDSSASMHYLTGGLVGYQNGIELSAQSCDDYDEWTDVLPGTTIQFTKVFETQNFDDPIELMSTQYGWNDNTESWGDIITYHTILTKEMKIAYVKEEVPYIIDIKGAGYTDSGKIVVDTSFTNKSDSLYAPSEIFAVQAYQGKKSLSLVSESQSSDGYYIQNIQIEPDEKVDMSSTFALENDDDVTVYLTVPETGEVYTEKTFTR